MKNRLKPQQKLVMVTYQFGEPIYIAPLDKNLTPQITDKVNEATLWSEFDGQAKLDYHRVVTGLKGLTYMDITN